MCRAPLSLSLPPSFLGRVESLRATVHDCDHSTTTALARLNVATERSLLPTPEREGSAALGRTRPRSTRLRLRDLVSCQNGTIRSPFIPSISLTQGSTSSPFPLSRPFLLPSPLQPSAGNFCHTWHVAAVPRSEIVIKRRFLDFDRSRSFRNAIVDFRKIRTCFFNLLKSYIDIKINMFIL